MEGRQVTTVLALNVGSSTLKFGLFDVDADVAHVRVAGDADTAHDGGIRVHGEEVNAQGDALDRIAHVLKDQPLVQAIGHRIVHGGAKLREHRRIDGKVLRMLDAARPFAPLHVPAALKIVRRASEVFPGVPAVACLDTAFHSTMPEVARILPLPRALRDEGIERYGFHGLSCESIVRELGPDLPSRTVIAHLGNGASVTAVLDGQSVDTSMGLTPAGGIVMGSRPGDLDPGVIEWLMREKDWSADELDSCINRQSGLKGLSGISSDMRELHASNESAAQLAIDVFVHTARKGIAAMAASMGGIDLLVFTGGIGEHDHIVRDSIVEGLHWAGIGPTHMAVVPTGEDAQIALHAARLAFA